MRSQLFFSGIILAGLWLHTIACAQTLPEFDFRQPAGAQGWVAAHDISQLTQNSSGLLVSISGSDPYLNGPAHDYPVGQLLWARLRLFSNNGGSCQLFYYTNYPTEAASASFNVPAGRLVEGRVPFTALGPGYRIRIDPPGTSGQVTLVSLRFEARSSLPDFDFGTVPDGTQWGTPHDLTVGANTVEGLPLTITGSDPYVFGPARDYPARMPLWMTIRLNSSVPGTAQLFYFTTGPTEANSVRFFVPAAGWQTLRVPLPPLWTGTRLRFDPPGTSGTCILGQIQFEARPTITPPNWPRPVAPVITQGSPGVTSSNVSLVHGPGPLGSFELRVNGRLLAVGNNRMPLGYVLGTATKWLTLTNPASLQSAGNELTASSIFADPDGGTWTFQQTFRPAAVAGGIDLETRVTVSHDRSVVLLPLAMLLPGLGSFGTNKTQGLLAGVEYLENEPSSSEADVKGPGANRRVPIATKLTFPLMALSTTNGWVSLSWYQQRDISALHDSPDRLFSSSGHVMALLFPGAEPSIREDGHPLPYGGVPLAAGTTLVLRATFSGGEGNTVIPAIRDYVNRRGLPALPTAPYSDAGYYDASARGWLHSQIRDGYKFRHAVGGSFGSAAAADAPLYMSWLAAKVPSLSNELINVFQEALALVSPSSYNSASVGHVRLPVPALAFRAATANATRAASDGAARLGIFQPDGTVNYVPPSGGLDLGATHWARHANGLTATHVAFVLEQALFSGNTNLVTEGLRLLRGLSKYNGTVPRGAQTWEVPLHTPDILASAYLVRACIIGYELTGNREFLDGARDWAWTGVPFVYLTPPTSNPVGPYATIPVFGATQFVAPLWIGLPVQWCGIVYGNAIRRLARHDPNGPWKQLADGIAISGIQQMHPPADAAYIGLLPDSFDLVNQWRNPVPINPATLLPEAISALGSEPVYDYREFLHHGLVAHAPGAITEVSERPTEIGFTVRSWPASPWQMLVNGFRSTPRVRIDGIDTPLSAPHSFDLATGRLILQLSRPARVNIIYGARDGLRSEYLPDNNRVKISWPAATTNYGLERSLSLGPAASWQTIGGPFLTQGLEQVYQVDPTGGAFFRLKRL